METIRQPKHILTDRTVRAILCLGYEGETNTHILSKLVGITSSHTYKMIMPKLVAWGCVKVGEKKGREKTIKLTPKGLEVFKRLEEIGELLGEPISETGDRRLDLIILNKNEQKDEKMNSPFRYAGGKFYARPLILRFVQGHTHYIEPFTGGASIFFAKPKVEVNWLNDIDKELINCLIHIRDFPNEMCKLLKGEVATKERHNFFKNVFKPKNDLEKAVRWFYLNRTSYSGIMNMKNCFWGYGDKFSMRPENWLPHIMRCSKKLQNVKITSKDFEEVIDAAPDGSFLFVDPPYFNADQDKFYTHSFTKEDHIKLVDVLKRNSNRLKFLLTYDDSQEIRQLYSWCNEIIPQQWFYTINRTDDQKNGTKKKGKREKGNEIFITNFVSKQTNTTVTAFVSR